MIKIFNLEMAIHFLKHNDDRELYPCGIMSVDYKKVTQKDINMLKKCTEDVKTAWMYQFYTQDLSGAKWVKYAELDVFDVEKDMFGKYPGWDSESEFLYIGYSRVISTLQEKIKKIENKVKAEKEYSKSLLLESTSFAGSVLNMVDDFEKDCPKEIKERLYEEYNNCTDEYKSDFHILPNAIATKHIKEQLNKWAFIAQETDVIDGWYAVWSIGD